jgi:peptidoglycan/LPS O-acetylase OafA/YrhL
MSIRKFRPDIEALRAIAIIVVLIEHAKLALPGGFIGVDIFFVISGFLITKHLHDEVFKNGSISLKNFYARRILRIFPASMLVLTLTLLGSFLFLSPLQLINYCWDAILSAFSGINYRLAITGTDYFQSTTTPSPFQHFWSLAVEEQFYLIWPLLILSFAKLFIRNKNKPIQIAESIIDPLVTLNVKTQNQNLEIVKQKEFTTFKYAISALLILIITVSLFLSYKISGESQMWAYFSLHTRAWQLAIGGLIAFNLPLVGKIPNKIASVLSWIGFGGLIASLILINKTTIYPGLWALLPTLATALIVIAGTHKTKLSFESFFDWSVVRGIGKISYSLYLIHWPIFVFIFYQLGDNIRITDKIAAVMISVMLSIVSLLLIENPIRFHKAFKNNFKLTYRIGLVMMLIVASIGYGVQFVKDRNNSDQKVAIAAINKSEADIISKLQEAIKTKEISTKLVKPLEQVAKETGSNCIAVETISTPSEGQKCRLGDKNAKQTIVLLGDSHANQWTKTIDTIAQNNGYQLIPFTKSGCSMTDIKHFNPLLKRDYTECYSYRKAVVDEIAKIKPDIIVTTELVYQNSTPETYTALIQKLQSMSKQVVRLTDTPRPTQNIPECLVKNSKDIQKCNFYAESGDSKIYLESKIEDKIAANAGAKIIYTNNMFCESETCPPIIDNIVAYNDDSHISETYASYLSNIINRKLFSGQKTLTQNIIESTKISTLPNNLVTSINQVSFDTLGGKCIDSFEAVTPSPQKVCTLGDTKSSKTIVLLGDSHAQQWIQAVDPIAQRNGYKLITYMKSACSLADIKLWDDTNKKDYVECSSWRKEVLDQVEKIKPDIIISSETLHSNSTVEKYSELMLRLKSISNHVIKIIDNPKATQIIPECLAKNSNNIQKCSFDPNKAFLYKELADKEVEESKKLQIPLIETLKWFCTDQSCPPIVDNIIVFYDNGHVSSTYSKYLSDAMEEQIFKIIPNFKN